MKKIEFNRFNKTIWSLIAAVIFIIAGTATNDNDNDKETNDDKPEPTEQIERAEPADYIETPEPEWDENTTEEESVDIEDEEIIFSNSSEDESLNDSIIAD